MASDSDDVHIDSDEGDDSRDLSHLGAVATNVKFQTVQKRSLERAKGESERLAQQILGTCQSSNQEVLSTSGLQEMYQSQARRGSGVLQQSVNFIQVNQQFGNVSVKETRNLTIGGTQNIGQPLPSQGDKDKTLSWIHKRTISRLESWTEGMVKTSALQKVLQKLNKGTRWVTISGSPGEGKTTVAYMALKELHSSGRQVFQVTSSKEFTKVISTYPQAVVMMDDIFGNLDFDQAKWLKWEPVLHEILDDKDHRSHEQGGVSSMKDISVIVVSRDYVLNSASYDLGKLSDYFTKEDHVFNMSHNMKRECQEKFKLWDAISSSSGIELDKKTVDTICSIHCPHGFPHVCRLFVTMRKKDPKLNAKAFFKSPLAFLNQTIVKFMCSKVKLQLFKEMITGDGKVTVRELGQLENGTETIQTAYDLVGTYLRKEDDYFIFHHPSIYDSVAYHLCKLYPLFVIENCHLSFIHERLRLQPSHDCHGGSDSDLVVHIPRSYAGDLAKRFTVQISKSNLQQILSHTVFRDEGFINTVMTDLTIPVTDLVKMIDINTSKPFLQLISSNKSPQLLMYTDNHPDIQLIQKDIDTVLHGVCEYAASGVLTYLSQHHATLVNINVILGPWKVTPLMIAAGTRNSHFVNQVLTLKPDLNAQDVWGKNAFDYLCKNGLLTAIKQVIDMGFDINAKRSMSHLYYASLGNHIEVVRLLLDTGARVDGEAVGVACQTGSLDIVNIFFERGATVNIKTLAGFSLHSACRGGHVKVIQYLIDKGASVNKPGESDLSPLHWACLGNKPQAVKCLLEYGADTDSRDILCNTPLHKSATLRSKECAGMLLEAAADRNIQNKKGNTPLHTAADWGSKECVSMLLEAGTDLNVQNKDGKTPLQLAQEKGQKECADMIQNSGANKCDIVYERS